MWSDWPGILSETGEDVNPVGGPISRFLRNRSCVSVSGRPDEKKARFLAGSQESGPRRAGAAWDPDPNYRIRRQTRASGLKKVGLATKSMQVELAGTP